MYQDSFWSCPSVLEVDDLWKLCFTSTDKLLRTVLSLYMPNKDLPLPTLEEVLFCDSKTTSEEVRGICTCTEMLQCNTGGTLVIALLKCHIVAETIQALSHYTIEFSLVIPL